MKLSRALSPVSLFLFGLIILTAFPAHAASDSWRPVDPAELALKTPVVEKDADAEVLFWDVRVADEEEDHVFTNYIRIKIFTERGKDSQSKVDIPYLNGSKVKDVAGRTIKPDGTIVELKKGDVFERTIIRASGLKIKAKSFAMPAVEPGAIIEYRWREVHSILDAQYSRLQFQRDIPVQTVTYHIKPLNNPSFPFAMRYQPFHMSKGIRFEKEKDGFYVATMTNVPAFHEEPRMPPEDQVRSWMLIYYTEDTKLAPDKFWKERGKELYSAMKSRMKVSDDVRRASTEAIGDATTPDQKLERLYDYCRAKIKNTSNEASGLTADERDNLKENKSPADTLKHGYGNGADIDLLFAAMATAAGLDARFARLANRNDVFFDPGFADTYFMRSFDIAVRVGDQWRFFDPGSRYVANGMLLWSEEGAPALVSDPKDPVFVTTQLSPPEKSLEKRTAKLRLSEDGTLEGDVRIEYTGHPAAEMKRVNADDSPVQREQTLEHRIKDRMSTAEISDIHIENVTDPDKPFVYRYHVRVPDYAERTGKRLFLQPAFFQRGLGPLFSTNERTQMIYFHYPWSESDTVTIDLPAGFALDHADAPNPLSGGKLSEYNVKIGVTKDERTLVYKRDFFFSGMIFPVSSYGSLKSYFDMLHKRDEHTITLKQTTAVAAETPSSK